MRINLEALVAYFVAKEQELKKQRRSDAIAFVLVTTVFVVWICLALKE